METNPHMRRPPELILRARLVIDVKFALSHPREADALRNNLFAIAERAHEEGLLTGETDAMVSEMHTQLEYPPACATDALRLMKVFYGDDIGLVSLASGELLACVEGEGTLLTPVGVSTDRIDDWEAEELFGEEHNWNDIIGLMRDRHALDHKQAEPQPPQKS